MIIFHTIALSISLLLTSCAIAAPKLADTDWHKRRATQCVDVDLNNWKHPARKVLIERGAKISRLQLCNAGKYPVHTVDLPYDPQGQTQEYFEPLYMAMRTANGSWPFALVSTSDQVAIDVSCTKKGTAAAVIEGFAE